MDSRERTHLALDHQQGDRIPIDFWASHGLAQKLKATRMVTLEDFKDIHDVDLRYIAGPPYIGAPLESPKLGLSKDIWAVTRNW